MKSIVLLREWVIGLSTPTELLRGSRNEDEKWLTLVRSCKSDSGKNAVR